MKIGIISEIVHEKKTSFGFLERILSGLDIPYKAVCEKNFDLVCVQQGKKKSIVPKQEVFDFLKADELLYEIEVTALELPYSGKEFDGVSDKLLKKYMYSALKKLKNFGIEKVVFTDEIKNVYATENISREILGRAFSGSVVCSLCELIKKLSAKCGINPLKAQFAVISKLYTPELYEILKTLVYDVGYIKIYTDDISHYLRVCENLYERFGIVADVYDYKTVNEINDLIICDFDSDLLKIGRDIIVNDVKYKINCDDYNIKDIEILDLINEKPKNFGIKYCISGKNRLTI